MSTINAKQDAKVVKMASKAADLDTYVTQIGGTKDFETKRSLAYEMAAHFKVGGKEKFLTAIESAKTAIDIDRICFNAVLKGEGMSTKRF